MRSLAACPSPLGSPLALALLAMLTLGVFTANSVAAFATTPNSTAAPARSAEPGAVSLSEYQIKLRSLDQLLSACQQAMTPENCESDRVGGDIKLTLPSGPRSIRFAWLRDVLDRAAKESTRLADEKKDADRQQAKQAEAAAAKAASDKAKAKKQESSDSKTQDSEDGDEDELVSIRPVSQFQEPTLAQQIVDARKRLSDEAASAAQLSAQLASPSDSQLTSQSPQPKTGSPLSEKSPEHQTLARILEGRDYHAAVAGPTLVDRFFEKLGNWIDRFLGKLSDAGFKSKWIGYSAEIGFVLVLCIGLIWFLVRLERQGRLGIGSHYFGPSGDAVSARDWQLWLRDARSAASRGAWREGIHLLYWASISRLESSGQWPADRARTPREYLALLSTESAQRPELTRLTNSFERTWYAGRAADESDFRAAERVASKLGVTQGTQ